jgi:hypothetical protein
MKLSYGPRPIPDFGAKCEQRETKNIITLENWELKKQE